MLKAMTIALFVQDSILFKLLVVGLPLSLPLVIGLLVALWTTKRGRDNEAAARALRTISALVTFELGILGTLVWYSVKDAAINQTNAGRYREAGRKIRIGMTKADVIELMGPPANINLSKDGEELWWWQSRHRFERPIAYRVIGKPPTEGGPYLLLSFDVSERVATVETSRAWR